MMRGLDARIQHGNTSLTIGDIDKKDNLQQPSEQETEEEETYE